MAMSALAGELSGFFKSKQCLHPLASRQVCGKVIAAHTIQRRGALAGIVDETGHCLTFYPPDGRSSPEPHRRGWRDASTFAGFCVKHDAPTFAALEATPFVGSQEQCFLLAYRAECHELYQKQASVRSHEPLRQVIDRGMSPADQVLVQDAERKWEAGVELGLADSKRYKALMDTEFLEKTFSAYQSLFVTFEGQMAVAATGAPIPNRSLSGEELLDLSDPEAAMHRLYVGSVPRDGGGAVVFVWRKGESAAERFIDELRALDWRRMPSIIVQFMLAHIENAYFSSQWWTSLSEGEKERVRILARMGDPYYAKWEYGELGLPWRITHVSDQWPAG